MIENYGIPGLPCKIVYLELLVMALLFRDRLDTRCRTSITVGSIQSACKVIHIQISSFQPSHTSPTLKLLSSMQNSPIIEYHALSWRQAMGELIPVVIDDFVESFCGAMIIVELASKVIVSAIDC